jgi:hypothetical protein
MLRYHLMDVGRGELLCGAVVDLVISTDCAVLLHEAPSLSRFLMFVLITEQTCHAFRVMI